LAQLGLGPVGPIGPHPTDIQQPTDIQAAYRFTDILLVYSHPSDIHPTDIQTSYIFRHPKDIQASYRCKDILQVYRHPAGIQTSYSYADILRVFRHPAGIQASYRYTAIPCPVCKTFPWWAPTPNSSHRYKIDMAIYMAASRLFDDLSHPTIFEHGGPEEVLPYAMCRHT